ncbi:hypothetical protein [Turicimonas muris]|uniref:hypothetical protein n=1 Tax=Turicimonas muris TaxID=1796652 RepID=UPI003F66D866
MLKTLMKCESFREKCPQGKPIVVADRGLKAKTSLQVIKNDCALSWRTVSSAQQQRVGNLFREEGWKYNLISETGEDVWKMKTMDCPDAVKQENHKKLLNRV